MQVLKRQARRFCVTCNAGERTSIELDFTPFTRFPDSARFIILHFQGKPKFHRQWGVYSVKLDQYFSRSHQQIKFDKGLETHAWSLDERVYKSLPTSVLIYPKATLEITELTEEIFIKNDDS